MAHQIRIDDVSESKSGKSWNVKSGDKWYSAFKDSGIDKLKGQTIEAEVEPFGKGGMGIKTYRVIGASNPPPASPAGIPTYSGVAPFWLPFASNVCAHAISSGRVQAPGDLKAWFLAAKEAAEGAAKDDVSF